MADRTFEVNITTAVQAPYAIKNAGHAGEHNATAIKMNLPVDYIGGFTYSLDIKTGAGEPYEIPIVLLEGDDYLIYEIPHPLTDKGTLDLTLKITETDTGMVVKSRGINLQFVGRDVSVYAELSEDYVPETTATEDCLNAAVLARDKIDELDAVLEENWILIQNEEPTDANNKVWIDPDGTGLTLEEEDISGLIDTGISAHALCGRINAALQQSIANGVLAYLSFIHEEGDEIPYTDGGIIRGIVVPAGYTCADISCSFMMLEGGTANERRIEITRWRGASGVIIGVMGTNATPTWSRLNCSAKCVVQEGDIIYPKFYQNSGGVRSVVPGNYTNFSYILW
jgi:hypothetical protein